MNNLQVLVLDSFGLNINTILESLQNLTDSGTSMDFSIKEFEEVLNEIISFIVNLNNNTVSITFKYIDSIHAVTSIYKSEQVYINGVTENNSKYLVVLELLRSIVQEKFKDKYGSSSNTLAH